MFWNFWSVFRGGGSSGNLPSPRLEIDHWDVKYDPDKKRLIIDNIEPRVFINTVQNTNSMEPMIDVGHIVVRSNAPKYMDNLNVGDVIVWQRGSRQVIHSIIETGYDNKGWFCFTKGLNLNRKDPEKIRKRDIRDVALLVIWGKGLGCYVPRVDD